jgi:hypothetical protein
MRSILRTMLAGATVMAALATAGLAAAPAASASTGGGCGPGTYVQFGDLTACISANHETVLPDGYVDWNTIPPGACSVELQLLDVAEIVQADYSYPCGWHHYGPLGYQGRTATYWSSRLLVHTSWGTAEADSPLEYLSY